MYNTTKNLIADDRQELHITIETQVVMIQWLLFGAKKILMKRSLNWQVWKAGTLDFAGSVGIHWAQARRRCS